MDGLPFVPGFRFNDIIKKDYHLSSQFQWKNGYAIPKNKSMGIGKALLDVDSALYSNTHNTVSYHPTLTYGQPKYPPRPIVQPHFIMFDGKCLFFNGFTKQTVAESPVEEYRIRRVKIIYYLVDDTISVLEPIVENAGYVQGCLLRRAQIPNPHRKNTFWHWSAFNNGVELSFYGVAYKLCNCDSFTRQFLSSQGVVVNTDEPIPDDPYMVARRHQLQQQSATAKKLCSRSVEDDCKLKQFLEYDGKVLRFYTAWNDNGSEPVEWKFFILLYFLADDSVEIYESKDKSRNTTSGQTPAFPLFLGKIKLPKDWSNFPSNFPSVYLEPGNKELQEYYQPKDFIIGNTIFVMGRRFLLYDCDKFTRNYFKEMLCIVQPDPIELFETKDNHSTVDKKVIIPPHTGIGDPDDSRQNCLSLTPKPPKTVDFVRYVLNSGKKLRYRLRLVPVYESDRHRDFVMEYCLGDGRISVFEVAGKNSGFVKGRFVAAARLRKPGTQDEDENLQYYSTEDFAVGAELHIRGLVFKIVELDLWTYNYMNENKDMFTQDAIAGAKCFLESKGLLNFQKKEDDISNQNSTAHQISNHNKFENIVITNKLKQLNIVGCRSE